MIFSASKSDLGRRCLWWAKPDSLRAESTSQAAQAGRDDHAAIERALRGITQSSAKAAQVVDYVISYFSGQQMFLEQAFEFDCATGACRAIDAQNRGYKRRDGCIYGTADAIFIDDNGSTVIDWKTGQSAPSAHDNGQLLTLGVMAAVALATPVSRLQIVHVTDDRLSADTWVVDDLDLEAHCDWMRRVGSLIATATPVAGPWCRSQYCPSYGLCPATSGSLAAVGGAQIVPLSRHARDIKDNAQAAHQYEVLRRFRAESAVYWTALQEWATRNGGIDLGGTRWAETQSKRREIDCSPEAIDTLRTVLGEHAAVALQPTEIAVGALKNACREWAKANGKTIAEAERIVFDALNGVGAIETKVVKKMEEK